jgi:hypothetical protein
MPRLVAAPAIASGLGLIVVTFATPVFPRTGERGHLWLLILLQRAC